MTKIAIASPGLSGGGAEKVASILANRLARRGYEVLFICVFSNDEEYPLDDAVKLAFIEAKGKTGVSRTISRSVELYRLLSDEKPDVTLSFVVKEMLLSELFGIKTIQTLRCDPTFNSGGIIGEKLRLLAYKHASHVVFQTEGAKNHFPKCVKEKSSILPNPIEIDSLPYWNAENKSKTFVSVGRLSSEKNHRMLVEAFYHFSQSHPGYSLDIYGVGPLEAELRSQISSLGLSESVSLKGRSSSIPEILASSFAFVLPSDYEGVSNAMLEALCVGIPCIVTDHPPGGAREYITNEENGLLTKVNDAEDMSRALCFAVEEESRFEQLGICGQRIRDLVGAEEASSAWERCIKEVYAEQSRK